MADLAKTYTAFVGPRRIASGDLPEVALSAKQALDADPWAPLLILDNESSEVVEIDFRGAPEEVLARLQAPDRGDTKLTPEPAAADIKQRPGRPKLGVVAREVTLLPRHWDWLAAQPGGASVALRKLVEQARRDGQGRDHLRRAQEAAYRFLSTMAGNLPGFEEATRALFAGDRPGFEQRVQAWPVDIRDHAIGLAAVAFESASSGAAR